MTICMCKNPWGGAIVGTGGATEGGIVMAVQQMIGEYNYYLGPTGADGYYGSYTEQAIKDYQSAQGITVDGIVGDQTCGKLWKNLRGLGQAGSEFDYAWSRGSGFADIYFRQYVNESSGNCSCAYGDDEWMYQNINNGDYYWMESTFTKA